MRAYYIAIGLAIIPAYLFGWQLLTNQQTWYLAIKNQLTVNFILFLGFYGYYIEKFVKGMPKWKGWLIWAIAVAVMIMFFKYVGGYQTWW